MRRSSSSAGVPSDADINKSYLVAYVFILTLSSYQIGRAMLELEEIDLITFLQLPTKTTESVILKNIVPVVAFLTCALTGLRIAKFPKRQMILACNGVFIVVNTIKIWLGLAATANADPIKKQSWEINAWIIYVYIAVRIIQGIPVGICSIIIPIYIRELSPREAAGRLGIMHQLMLSAGMSLTLLLSAGISKYHLWGMIGVDQIAVAVIQTIFIMKKYEKETPKYLYFKECKEEATVELSKLYKSENRVSQEVLLLRDSWQDRAYREFKYNDLCTLFYRPALLVSCAALFFQQAGGYYLHATNNIILTQAEADSLHGHYFLIGQFTILGVILVCSFIGLFYIDKIKRLKLIKTGFLTSAILNLCISGFCLAVIITDYGVIASIIFSVLAHLCIASYVLLYGPVIWVYVAEILPDAAFAIAINFSWLAIIGVSLINISCDISQILDKYFLVYSEEIITILMWTHIGFACLMVIGIAIMKKYAKETQGLTEIAIKYLHVPIGVREQSEFDLSQDYDPPKQV